MRLAGIIFSAIFALIAIPLFTMAACNLAVEAAFLNRSTYDDVLNNDVIFEDLLTVALPVVLTAPGAGKIEFEGREESPILFRDLTRALEDKPKAWEEVTSLLIPPEWIQQTVTDFVDIIFAISEGNFDVIDSTVDVSEIRQRFTGEEASQAATIIVTQAPSCTAEELSSLDTFFTEPLGIMPICNPLDEEMQQKSIHVLELWFAALASHFSQDQPSVTDIFGLTRDDARSINLIVELDRQGLVLTYLCPMALLSLIVIFTVRSRKSFGRWIGASSVISGIVILITTFALQVALLSMVSQAVNAQTEAEQFFARLISELLRSAFSQSSSSMLIQAAIFIGIGFVLLVVAGFSGGQSENNGSSVFITEDGQIISTATQKRIGTIAQADEAH